jgi:hypothetical protein
MALQEGEGGGVEGAEQTRSGVVCCAGLVCGGALGKKTGRDLINPGMGISVWESSRRGHNNGAGWELRRVADRVRVISLTGGAGDAEPRMSVEVS